MWLMPKPDPIDEISIGGDVIRLGQFLKFAGLLDSGGDAKEVIIDGLVQVNGEEERRRGRQLHDGDLVTFEGRTVRVRS
jgi:ribosome-associated protein